MKLVVKVNGGLGNQMFQYALGRKLAITRNAELYLDLSFFDQHDGVHTRRPFELDVFNVHYERATADMLEPFQRLRSSRLHRALGRLGLAISPYRIFPERGFPFDPSVFEITNNTYVDGHWQSEKYFSDVSEEIRRDLTFSARPEALVKEMADRIQRSNAISLHVRRGDYVSNGPVGQFHGVCDADYYARAVGVLLERVESPTLFVFSDDLAWARENLHFAVPMIFVDPVPEIGDWSDMRLMAQCKHHIIANSSFSWWGAWLNASSEKLVVAPSLWFLDPAIDTRDLIPTGWIKL